MPGSTGNEQPNGAPALFDKGGNGFPTRYIFAILAFVGLFNMYALRVDLSVAIVAMVKTKITNTTLNASSVTQRADMCPLPNDSFSNGNASEHATGEFEWDGYTQGIVLGSYFYGYVLTQFPGAWVANRFGAKYVLGLTMLISGLLSLVLPVLSRWNLWALVAVRFLQGFVGGVSFPCVHGMCGKWIPPMERTKLSMLIYAGPHFGTVFTLMISGVLAEHLGWDSVFYVFGALACVWFVLWVFFAYNSPEEHPRISVAEKNFLIAAIGNKPTSAGGGPQRIPWSRIARSLPFYAICVAFFGNNWGFFTLLTNLPSYLARVLHFRIEKNGVISALPYLALGILMPIVGVVADKLIASRTLSTTTLRRAYHLIGQLSAAGCLIMVALVGCNVVATVTLLICAVGLLAFSMASFAINHIDIAPQYAGILMGITNTVGAVPGIAGPYLVGVLTSGPDGHNLTQWSIVFYVTAGIFIANGIFYACCASGELQPWDKPKTAQYQLAKRASLRDL
ncbi:sialin-like [Paramacrobiotus metropolitanus]|uniref:sialin-like n=1 Tax=Paramacrobiotus metropolitanus TaxID=2943436 RepID=UPI002445A6B9|nr:sialin-like [Paramacrobiotus metropolitanus]XP_055339657.1 sialin-like [Paramacrobiotus metropolitanus]